MKFLIQPGDEIGLSPNSLGQVVAVRGPLEPAGDDTTPNWSVEYKFDGRTHWLVVRQDGDAITARNGQPLHYRLRYNEEPDGQLTFV